MSDVPRSGPRWPRPQFPPLPKIPRPKTWPFPPLPSLEDLIAWLLRRLEAMEFARWPRTCISGTYAPVTTATPPGRPNLSLLFTQPPSRSDPNNARFVNLAGDDANTGVAGSPWRTLAHAFSQLTAGQALYVEPGAQRYQGGAATHSDGPIWVIGNGATVEATSVPTPLLRLGHRQWVVRDLNLRAVATPGSIPVLFSGASDTYAVGVHVDGFAAGAGFSLSNAKDCLVTNCRIADGRSWTNPGKQLSESHGILIGSGCARIAVVGCTSFNHDGDALQVQDSLDDARVSNPFLPAPDRPTDIYIQDNDFYENRSQPGMEFGENAIDLKSCDRVLALGNRMHGYRRNIQPPNSSPTGDAVVVHITADNIIVEHNVIFDCGRAVTIGRQGVPSTGVVVFRFNRVYGMRLQRLAATGVVGGSGSGIRCGPARQVEIYHNTFHGLESVAGQTTGVAIRVGDGDRVDRATVLNNVVSQAGIGLAVNDVGSLGCGHNVYHQATAAYGQPVTWNNQSQTLAAWQAAGYDCGSTEADPRFANAAAHDYRVQAATARDAAVPLATPPPNAPQICGNGPDIGAVENCP